MEDDNIDSIVVKLIIQNYEYANVEDIKQVLTFIANIKKTKIRDLFHV